MAESEPVGPLGLRDLSGARTVFMSQTLTFRAPAYVGDTLTARVQVVSLKPDKPVCPAN